MAKVKTKNGNVTLIPSLNKHLELVVGNPEFGESSVLLTPGKIRQLVKYLAKYADEMQGVEGWTIRPAMKAAGIREGIGNYGPSLDGYE